MAEIQLVETSLRDGNQSLWAALGVDTARTLTIAPVMDRVGFKAIDLRKFWIASAALPSWPAIIPKLFHASG